MVFDQEVKKLKCITFHTTLGIENILEELKIFLKGYPGIHKNKYSLSHYPEKTMKCFRATTSLQGNDLIEAIQKHLFSKKEHTDLKPLLFRINVKNNEASTQDYKSKSVYFDGDEKELLSVARGKIDQAEKKDNIRFLGDKLIKRSSHYIYITNPRKNKYPSCSINMSGFTSEDLVEMIINEK